MISIPFLRKLPNIGVENFIPYKLEFPKFFKYIVQIVHSTLVVFPADVLMCSN